MAEPTTVTLAHPIKRDGATISSLEVRRPRVGDLRHLESLPSGASMLTRELAMMARLTGLPAEVLDELDATDYAALTEAAAGFSDAAPAAGSPTPPSSPV